MYDLHINMNERKLYGGSTIRCVSVRDNAD